MFRRLFSVRRLIQAGYPSTAASSGGAFLRRHLNPPLAEHVLQGEGSIKGFLLCASPSPSAEQPKTSPEPSSGSKAGDSTPEGALKPKTDPPPPKQNKPTPSDTEEAISPEQNLKKTAKEPGLIARIIFKAREKARKLFIARGTTKARKTRGKFSIVKLLRSLLRSLLYNFWGICGLGLLSYGCMQHYFRLWNQLELAFVIWRGTFLNGLSGNLPDFDESKPLDVDEDSEMPSSDQPGVTPYFIKEMREVLIQPTNRIILVEGQKGIGKTTSMKLLCWHLKQHNQPSLFLRFSPGSYGRNETIVITDPISIPVLANYYRSKGLILTVYIDDLNKYLREATDDATYGLISQLWLASEEAGARIILTTSEYGLIDMVRNMKRVRSVRFSKVRMFAPEPTELFDFVKKIIDKEALKDKTKGKSDEEKKAYWYARNPDEDIKLYCQVVGNYREVLDFIPKGMTVREITRNVFRKTLVEVNNSVSEVCAHYPPKLVARVLNTLCESQQFVSITDSEKKLCQQLTMMNIIRPTISDLEVYEFHRFSTEVAVRALLGKPSDATHVKRMSEQVEREYESTGRGTIEEIAVLVAQVNEFKMMQAEVKSKLKVWSYSPRELLKLLIG